MGANKNCTALQCLVGTLVALAGVLSEISDGTLRRQADLAFDLHFAFGVMLCLGVLCRFQFGLWMHRTTGESEVTAFARQLTRSVYLLLYSLLAVKVVLPFVGGGGTSPESFQPYLAAGIVAVLLTRGLARVPPRLTARSALLSTCAHSPRVAKPAEHDAPRYEGSPYSRCKQRG